MANTDFGYVNTVTLTFEMDNYCGWTERVIPI